MLLLEVNRGGAQARGTLSEADAARVAHDVLQVLQECHRQGILYAVRTLPAARCSAVWLLVLRGQLTAVRSPHPALYLVPSRDSRCSTCSPGAAFI